MPELPEVETVLRTLEARIRGKRIMGIIVLFDKLLANCDAGTFEKRLTGKSFDMFERRGKYLIFHLEDECLIVHLRMEGKFYIQKKEEELIRHTHAVFALDDGYELRYNDVRKFGRFYLYRDAEEKSCLNKLGPDPWDKELTVSYLMDAFSRHPKTPIKAALLDQEILAGIGNIYANEICFAAKILPVRPVSELNKEEVERILKETQRILKEAIAAGGTTIRSYTSSLGVTGLFQQDLYVHTKEKCRVCGSDIERIRISGRSTYYCPGCQK